MDFYFPDSQDQIDPNFDFESDEHPPFHVRQRDDRYPHEIHDEPPYTGMLISKTMVDGYASSGRYTAAQRHRLFRSGVHEFFRLPEGMKVIGDCGGFSYVGEERPPVSVGEVIDFYETIGVDEGISVDHVVLGFQADSPEQSPDENWVERQTITLELAGEFMAEHKRRGCRFEPMGAAQGWSPASYVASVQHLQDIGYRRIALGGMAPLKLDQILACLEAIEPVRNRDTSLHLLGVSRTERCSTLRKAGVQSLDSTSPFRQAFKDDRANYYGLDGVHHVALRIPPSDSNSRLQARIRAGQLPQRAVQLAEQRALEAVRAYDRDGLDHSEAVAALIDYERLIVGKPQRDRTEAYRLFLDARPWRTCECQVCRRWGVEVAIFRGTERNKRRGFHNLWVFNQRMQGHIAAAAEQESNETMMEVIGEST